ncbi:peptidase M28 [Gemmatirosa kalamazoonensis]|uniref:Peptidase M28 n=1 Tax=Gemmatirosa kalamazoonensis TaxID=861299 RepID=W0REQ9_9BACT|nr:M28 family peptidase [Gemmatirosa kalamazoonensis]AHG88932.1 peptidase M28 [Gemmatirosa kalamazoonensis]
MPRAATLSLLCCLPGALHGQRVTKAAPTDTGPTTAAITPADLRRRLYVFAADSMMGRAAGTADNLRATAYIERELRRLGLVPGGDGGSFFQQVPLVRRGVGQDAALTIDGVDGARFVAGRDFLVRDPGAAQRSVDGAATVYGGTWGDSSTYVAPAAANGKLVVVDVRRGWEADRAHLLKRYRGAAGIAVASYDSMPPDVRGALSDTPVSLADGEAPVVTTGATPAPVFLYVTRALRAALLGAPGRTVRGDVAFGDQPAPARNVVAILPGSDPAMRGQYVALGAHNDHVGYTRNPVDHDSMRAVLTVARPLGADSPERPLTAAQQRRVRALTDSLHRAHGGARPDSIYNGADDDGSGSMALLEIAEQLASLPTAPKRSIVFVWHTGEELGLYGSQWFTDHPTVPRDSIVAQLNMDMIGRGSASDVTGGGPAYLQLIGSRRLSTELGDLIERVNRETDAGFRFDYAYDANGHPEQYYCRSDHYEYARYGIPITFFSTGGHRDYHEVTDEPQYIDYDHYARVTTLVRDVAVRIANLDHRLVVDRAKPDPHGECRQ